MCGNTFLKENLLENHTRSDLEDNLIPVTNVEHGARPREPYKAQRLEHNSKG